MLYIINLIISVIIKIHAITNTEPMFRFKFADAGNMSPPLISFSEVAFSYSGKKKVYTDIYSYVQEMKDDFDSLYSYKIFKYDQNI
jgi:hypothetical protein